ncbi:hypothetical protein DPMN_127147 [Dreissena polymorpha]|uniref:Uncharacterized protein n=1 Tax=Dreissena polymorpha TaxID=45954 RepID=A0A9D4JYW0_DREPO|nr:hypothetical protein DPMN_127147 [Dreissena polymorpha]
MTAHLVVINAVRILSASALECSLERTFADSYCACGYADADEWDKRSAFQLVLFFTDADMRIRTDGIPSERSNADADKIRTACSTMREAFISKIN